MARAAKRVTARISARAAGRVAVVERSDTTGLPMPPSVATGAFRPSHPSDLINDDEKLLENSFTVPDAALADVPAALQGTGRNGSVAHGST